LSTVLITGGCGFVGSHLARFLLERDYNVVLMDLNVNGKLIKDIKGKSVIVRADITDREQLTQTLKRHRADVVAHYAALLSVETELNPHLGFKVDVEGVWNVLNAARDAEVNSVVFASSDAAYGPDASENAREDEHTIPETLYGISKQFGEMIGLWFHRKYGIQFVAFRYASIIGPGRRDGGGSAYSTLMVQKPAQGEPYEVNVRKEDVMPIVYVKDVAEVTTIAFENIPRLKSRIYNVSSLSPSPTATKIASCVRKHIPKAEIAFRPDPLITAMVDTWPKHIDTRRVQTELNWRPRFSSLDMLIGDFIREVKENPEMFFI